MRAKYGYRRMFDSTLRTMKLTRDASETIEYQMKIAEGGLNDVNSYDPC